MSLGRPVAWIVPAVLVVGMQAGWMSIHARNERTLRTLNAYAKTRGQVLTIHPGKGRMVLVPTIGGSPAPALDAAARVQLLGGAAKPEWIDVRVVGGQIELDDVPTGQYEVSLSIDANPANGWMMGGDYIAGQSALNPDPLGGTIILDEDGLTVRRELPTVAIMGLHEPAGMKMSSDVDDPTPATVRTPVTFAWDGVPHVEAYHYSVRLISERGSQVVARGDGSEATWTVDLAPTGPHETYRFELTATGPAGTMGFLETTRGFVVAGGPQPIEAMAAPASTPRRP